MSEKYLELFGNRIKELRLKKGFSQEEMAERSGLDRTFISILERGQKNPSLSTLVRLCTSLGIGLDSLFRDFPNTLAPDSELTSEEIELPLMGTAVSCGLPIGEDHFVEEKIALEKLITQNPERTFYVRSRGESMLPTIREGDILIVNTQTIPRNSSIVLAQVSSEFTVKRYNKSKNIITLTADNSLYPSVIPEEGDQVCGVITGIIRNF